MGQNTSSFDFLDTLGATTCRQAMFDCLESQLASYGIGGFAYGYVPMRTSRGPEADRLEVYLHHTFPKAWQETCVDEDDPMSNDATAMLLLRGYRRIDWVSLRAAVDQLGPEVERKFQAEYDLGMHYGMGMMIGQDRKGRVLSGAGLWFKDRPNEAAFWADWGRYGEEIAQVLHLFDTAARGDKSALMIGLTTRERDALCYLASGYRSAEASWIMKISERTFEKHVARAKAKLNARTRDHLIAKALVLGLIEP